MIPYFTIPSIPLFGGKSGLGIHAFGVLVASGILLGAWMMNRRARQLGLDRAHASSLATWLVVAGFIVAHIFDVLAYRTGEFLQRPWILVDPRTFSISSFGGFLGAAIGLVLWRRKYRQPVLGYADSATFGLAFGWFLGRLGCFTAHDHPGRLSDFVLAVRYPGGARHDLGFYEALFTLALCLFFLVLFRRPQKPGTYAAWICVLYAPVRFFLDFLRADDLPGADPRYLGLTPGQYSSLALLLSGLALIWYVRKRGAAPTPSDAKV